MTMPTDWLTNWGALHEWLASAARNRAFDFLEASREDVYSASDGEPFRDPG